MKRLKHYTIVGIFFVIIVGTLFHFLYEWTNKNLIIGLFTPINESVWEHMKLVFFPMLLYSFIMILTFKKEYPSIISSLCFGILFGTLLVPLFFYLYTFILGKNIFILDFTTFILSIIIAFFAVYQFTLSGKLQHYTFLLSCLVCILFIVFILFTFYPPAIKIFEDPAQSETTLYILF